MKQADVNKHEVVAGESEETALLYASERNIVMPEGVLSDDDEEP